MTRPMYLKPMNSSPNSVSARARRGAPELSHRQEAQIEREQAAPDPHDAYVEQLIERHRAQMEASRG